MPPTCCCKGARATATATAGIRSHALDALQSPFDADAWACSAKIALRQVQIHPRAARRLCPRFGGARLRRHEEGTSSGKSPRSPWRTARAKPSSTPMKDRQALPEKIPGLAGVQERRHRDGCQLLIDFRWRRGHGDERGPRLGVGAQAPGPHRGACTARARTEWFTTAPSAASKVVAKAGWKTKDVDLYEINEAFASVTMAAMADKKLTHAKVNVHGGASALGHPVGASGARLVTTLSVPCAAWRQARRCFALPRRRRSGGLGYRMV